MNKVFTAFTTRSIFCLSALLLLLYNPLKGQMVIDDSLTPTECVEDVLLGNGVSISNIMFNGQPGTTATNQVGYFDATQSNLPIATGVVMATGGVTVAESPNNLNAASVMPTGPSISNDADLFSIASGATVLNDLAVLEFDFVPQGDSVVFNYSFASDEYNGFACSSFNDVFGFFISGPGISGPFENNAENIALIPGTNTPVAINTINNGPETNTGPCEEANPNFPNDSIYYIDNEFNIVGGIDPNIDADSTVTEFDGFTTQLAAIANVQCGETYHIKMAIADAGDTNYDSGVFLQSESFTSNAAIEVELQTPVGLIDSTLYEGCGYANLIFTNPGDSSLQTTAYLSFDGTLENGVDIEPQIPDSIVFAPFQEEIVYEITAPNDGTYEGLEQMTVTIENIATACDGDEIAVTSNFNLYVNEAEPLNMEVQDYDLEGCNDTVQIGGNPIGGYGNYHWQWSNGSTDSSLYVSPGTSTTYTLTLSDTCDTQPVTKSITVNVPEYDPVVANAGEDFEVSDCDSQINLSGSASGGFGTFQYNWIFEGTSVSSSPTLNTEPTGLQNLYVLEVSDACGATDEDTVMVSVPPVNLVANAGPDRTVTDCRDSLSFEAVVYGGVGLYEYEWHYDDVLVDSVQQTFVDPIDGASMNLQVTDECGNTDTDSVNVDFDLPPFEVDLTKDTVICKAQDLILIPRVSGGVGNYDYNWSGNIQQVEDSMVFISTNRTSVYHFEVTDECGSTFEQQANVNVSDPHANFAIEYFDYYGISTQNNSSSGDYLWEFGDGDTTSVTNPRHVYEDTKRHYVVLNVKNKFGCTAVDSIEVTPPLEIFVPNVFTPNGDGRNDLWGPKGIEIEEYEMTIFDRWGKEVFHTTNKDEKWNGAYQGSGYFVPTGVYNYLMKVKGPKMEELVERSGSVTVIR